MSTTEMIKLAILTRSNKRRDNNDYGSCIAGVTATGEWIRLVSDKSGDSIPTTIAEQILIKTVIEAEIERAPLKYQPENCILLNHQPTQDNANPYIQSIRPVNEVGIFGNRYNQVQPTDMSAALGSLRFIKVENLSTYRYEGGNCKAKFAYQGYLYEEMAMTAPGWYAAVGRERTFGNAYIVVSLPNTPAFNKFVAAIYPIK